MSKPLVLIVGATGYTGRAIANAILEEGKSRLAILVRAQSVNKPVVKELVAAGAELRVGDTSDPPEKLEEHLAGVETLICTVLVWVADQKPLFAAAKKLGVGRVVPSDFGPVAPKGAMWMNDIKIGIHEYIEEIGLPYTFIYVGWWLTFMWPTPHSEHNTLDTPKFYAGSKDQKLIYSTFPSIGKLVARIIADPRTINQTVVAHDGEITLRETWGIGEKVTGEDFSDYYKASEADLDIASKQSVNWMKKTTADYYRSLYIRGDNTIAKAEAAGALIARKLYPDVPYPDVLEEAKARYATSFVPEYGVPLEELLDVYKPE
ncbi:hypothetical protein CCMSSC00406_0007501 [Pleurotus cornucopiae]|uniref:Uncharacterized protein n=1 Tax=Pleurotus cornucopiae TaxID=5321 RepID=A0ACB7J4Z1_PLECO|nr:hypothetical protein CCMSSC00406_0007501 [Pleurotus cornucopiae]